MRVNAPMKIILRPMDKGGGSNLQGIEDKNTSIPSIEYVW